MAVDGDVTTPNAVVTGFLNPALQSANLGLYVVGQNTDLGNAPFTGGNAANTLKVTVLYFEFDYTV